MIKQFLLFLTFITFPVCVLAQENTPDASEVKTVPVVNLLPKVEIPKPTDLISPTPVPAFVPVTDNNGFKVGDPDLMNPLDIIEKAVTTRNYFYGAAGFLMLVMWFIKKRWSQIPPDMIPVVTLAMSGIPAIILVLMRPNVDGMTVLKQVGIIWLMTGGAWESIGKKVATEWGPKIMAIIKNPTPASKSISVTPVVENTEGTVVKKD